MTLKKFLTSIQAIRPELNLSAVTLIIGVLFGVNLALAFLSTPEKFLEFMKQIFEDILNIQDQSFPTVFLSIFGQNLRVAILTIVAGIIFRFLPLVAVFFNGAIIGAVGYAFSEFTNVFQTLWMIMPHGIFEIPAFLIASGVGVSLSSQRFNEGKRGFFQKLFNRFHNVIKRKQLVVYVVVLLIIAAAIESALIIWD